MGEEDGGRGGGEMEGEKWSTQRFNITHHRTNDLTCLKTHIDTRTSTARSITQISMYQYNPEGRNAQRQSQHLYLAG